MGSTGKTTSSIPANLQTSIDKIRGEYGDVFANGIENALAKYLTDFREVFSLTDFGVESPADAGVESTAYAWYTGSVDTIRISEMYLFDPTDFLIRIGKAYQSGWSAGDGTFRSIMEHELAHNLELDLGLQMDARRTEAGLSYKDTIFTIDGKNYTRKDVSVGAISSTICKIAVENVQKNCKALGYASIPTEKELIESLSGYANSKYFGGTTGYREPFAEALADYYSNGKNANPLSQEIYRVTKNIYKQIKKLPLPKWAQDFQV